MADEKKNWLGPYIPEGNILREVVQQVKLAYHLMLDARVPALAKLIPLAAIVYVFSPVDLISDLIPVLGQMDDAAIVMLGIRMFFEVAPPEVVREYLKRLARPLASSEWQEVDATPPAAAPAPEVIEGAFKPAAEVDKPADPPAAMPQ